MHLFTKEMKSFVYQKTCTKIFVAKSLVLNKILKLPKYPLAVKWILSQYIHTMKYYTKWEWTVTTYNIDESS